MFKHALLIIGTWLFCCFCLIACHSSSNQQTTMQTYVFRLRPGQDLKKEIEQFVREKDIRAGWVLTSAGSLTRYNIRFANRPGSDSATGHFEIVSLSGTVSVNGCHLHMSVSDSTGRTIGGHLVEGNMVYTTAEIVLQSDPGLEFFRENDGTTPWKELQVRKRAHKAE